MGRAWIGKWCLALGLFGFGWSPGGAADAWGPEGHQVVAEIAQHHLSAKTRDRLRREFNIKHLARVANWADRIKDRRPETRPDHYTNIPAGIRHYDAARDCPGGHCVTGKVSEHFQTLSLPGLPRPQREEALKFLVHFVADVHQPMHLGNPDDRGGNEIPLHLHGKPSNLHRLWDHELIPHPGQSLVQYAAQLNRGITRAEVREWQASDVIAWTEESRALALEAGYALELDSGGAPTSAYLERGRAIAERRLRQAGIRLAGLLNRALE